MCVWVSALSSSGFAFRIVSHLCETIRSARTLTRGTSLEATFPPGKGGWFIGYVVPLGGCASTATGVPLPQYLRIEWRCSIPPSPLSLWFPGSLPGSLPFFGLRRPLVCGSSRGVASGS
ncbi:hypothetical protein L596_000962 [Steinernema carpocapsae]|uniref:Uncharacterized protein n=1 Tax=Steinernema carpocapsae TaxID=34508 RepID=A0A4U8ULY4_STECR|nr:hypothetical protein L596_000962 [Steinernema carpocapsae]